MRPIANTKWVSFHDNCVLCMFVCEFTFVSHQINAGVIVCSDAGVTSET